MGVIGGVEEQFCDATSKEVKVCKVECIDWSELESPVSFSYLFSGFICEDFILFVAFLADTPPHGVSIIKVSEDTEVSSNTRPRKFNPAINQTWVFHLKFFVVHEVHFLKLLDQISAIL